MHLLIAETGDVSMSVSVSVCVPIRARVDSLHEHRERRDFTKNFTKTIVSELVRKDAPRGVTQVKHEEAPAEALEIERFLVEGYEHKSTFLVKF